MNENYLRPIDWCMNYYIMKIIYQELPLKPVKTWFTRIFLKIFNIFLLDIYGFSLETIIFSICFQVYRTTGTLSYLVITCSFRKKKMLFLEMLWVPYQWHQHEYQKLDLIYLTLIIQINGTNKTPSFTIGSWRYF